MSKNLRIKTLLQMLCCLAAVAFNITLARASTNIFNFDSDPSGILTIRRASDGGVPFEMPGQWFGTNGSTLELGVSDQSTNGYLAITQTTPDLSAHGMRSTIVFDDFDNGLIVAGFNFSCDVRIGAGNATPADGFSLNFARDTDPAIFTDTFGAGPDNNPPSGQEEGTTTGLVISFDSYQNSSSDTIGLTIKVDNNVITNFPMPVLNGGCTNANSLQTGPATTLVSDLCWQPLNILLQTNGLLNVRYKNVTLLTNFPTQFAPSPGRLIFAGRTGASYQEQDVDNIRIITFASAAPVVAPSTANANGFRFNIIDSGFATPDTNTITMTLDGVTVTPTAITQSGFPGGGNGVTTVGYQNTSLLLAAGSTHTNTVHFTGSTFSGAVDATNVFTVPAYTILSASQKAPGVVNTNLSGFAGRIHQLPVPRFPSPANLAGIERQLADQFIDTNTSLPYVSIASVTNFTSEMINWNQDQAFGGIAGFFNYAATPPMDTPDDPIPGIDPNTGLTDNIAAEILTILDLPAGAYQLGVNHDDGFKLSVGSEPRDVLKATVLSTSAAAGDTSPINIVVTNAGKYPFRLVWGENTGGAQLELYLIDFATGQKILINNRLNPVQIDSYSDTSALTQPYVKWVSPGPGEAGDPRLIIAKLVDGTAGTIIPGSVSLKVNGNGTALVSKSGGETTATLATSTIPPGTNVTATLVYSTSTGGPITNTWTFAVSYFGQVLLNIPLNEGSDTNIFDTIWGLMGSFTTNNPVWTRDTPSRASSDFAVQFTGAAGRKALMVDTNHVISLGPDSSGANGDYTLQAWVKLPVGFEPASRMIIFSYEGIPGFAFSINTGRTLHTTTFGLNDVTSTTVVPNDGEWHQVAVVHQNGVSMKFYLDGVLNSETPYTRGPGTRTSFTVSIGGAVGSQNNIFTGTLDRIRFTRGALDPSQMDIPIPVALAAQRNGSTITLSWPTSGGNLIPQSANAISSSGTVWTDVPGTPVINGSTVSLDVTAGTGTKFYRLRPAP
jgi:Concanavalin A-like lectin/glucanases superfamily